MLTTDENIVDIDFQVDWNIKKAQDFLFSLANPHQSVVSISDASMREVIAQSDLATILNRDTDALADELRPRSAVRHDDV